jgi:hypothetical protein
VRIYERGDAASNRTVVALADHQSAIESLLAHSLHAPIVRVFSDEADYKEYYIARIRSARLSVDDLTWSHRVAYHHQLKHVRQREDRLDTTISLVSELVVYREIFAFNVETRRAKLLRRMLENRPGYSCSHIESPGPVPRLQFVIIDNEEAIFTSEAFGQKFAIRNVALIAALRIYFEYAWDQATPLKRGDTWHVRPLTMVLGQDIAALQKRARRSEFITPIDDTPPVK